MNPYDANIAPRFHEVRNDLILNGGTKTHYILKGGRMSCKSAFIALTLITLMSADDGTGNAYAQGCHAVAIRKYQAYLAGSVYNRLLWAMAVLGVESEWIKHKSPLELIHKRTKNKIIFLGADETERLKSITAPAGYYKYIWFEELAELGGEEDVRSILQSLMRGGEKFAVFYSYNPPKSCNNWANAWARDALQRSDTLVHHSTYRTIALSHPEWLGRPAIDEAERLKGSKPLAYRHELLGEEIGTGGAVFDNITIRSIAENEIARFDKLRRGLDLGFACDPDTYGVSHHHKGRLYIFSEFWKYGLKIEQLGDLIKAENVRNELITADSEDPRSIYDLQCQEINVQAAVKGPGSVERGMKWLQRLDEIIIDDKRCPNTAREFLGYEYPQDRYGNFRSNYPDKNNHSIDRERYANEDLIRGEEEYLY
ncbi:MAG: PBSX family phage terminase large subunit [Candidatus Xenobiia bacterium LiM19]